MTTQRSPRVLHPYLFALFPALSLLADHVEYLAVNGIVAGLLVVTLGVTVGGIALLRAAGAGRQNAGLILSFCLLLFFSYGHVFYLAATLPGVDIRHRHLLTVWVLLAILALALALPRHRTLDPLTRFLNVVGASLVALSVLQIAWYEVVTQDVWMPGGDVDRTAASMSSSSPPPDIYYIILDTYPSASTLRDVFAFDNAGFLGRLEKQGFFIADESFSNYAMTRLSLASSLNLDYLDALSVEITNDERGGELLWQMIEHNRAAQYLQARGYRFIFLGSGMGVTQANRHADEEVRCGRIDDTVERILQSTLLWPLAEALDLMREDGRHRIRCMFDRLADAPGREGPAFVFAHITAPHMPFLFDARGEPVEEVDPARVKEHYVEQLIFVNTRVEETVSRILASSTPAPIIILQGDTGPPYGIAADAAGEPIPALYQQRLRILNAYYVPPGASTLLYEGISPVNTFRVLFNHLFAAELPLRADRGYFSTTADPFGFVDVTGQVDYR